MNFRKAFVFSLLAPVLLAPGAFSQTAYRFSHTSTLLPDGDILLTGGIANVSTSLNSVQVYNMKTNAFDTWASGFGGANLARSSHTATLMSNGKVLIAGGFLSGGTPTNLLTVCNPATKTCADAGWNMLTARGGHTATLLSKGPRAGQVLLCGGQSGGATTITSACETFNPAAVAGPDAAANSLTSPRMGHTASLVKSGKVFVSGGKQYIGGTWTYNPQNEMYDPDANLWTPVSSLLQGRVSHTATVLNNGIIMIAGGYQGDGAIHNSLYCQASEPAKSLDDDCWHMTFDPLNIQNVGTHGYIDGAEFFDQNGARVALQESTYGEIPYRVAGHSAMLKVDGTWMMQGGYGNIFPTFFTNSPSLTDDSVFNLTPTGAHTADIVNTSSIKFPLEFNLTRPVSGRLVDADIFLSGPEKDTPSVSLDNADIDVPSAVAPIDGLAVGQLLGDDYAPGTFKSTVRILNPSGTVVFTPLDVDSGTDPLFPTTVVTSTLTIAGGAAYPEDADKFIQGSILTNVAFRVPNTQRGGIVGTATLQSAEILDNNQQFTLVLNAGGTAGFDLSAPTCDDIDTKTCLYQGVMNFIGVIGSFSNLTTLVVEAPLTNTTFYNPVGINQTGGKSIILSMKIDYVARQMSVMDRSPEYNFTQSSAVIRGMVFNTKLGYSPDTNKWDDITDGTAYKAMARPTFNHTALYTPAADAIIMGGRNCEFNPAVDCLRASPRFSTATIVSVEIPVYRSADGSALWPEGPSLKTKRAYHTTTLLPDGTILTCGGSDGAKPLASCEMIVPNSTVWTETGSMNLPRSNHTATLLPNGTVLAVGGVTTAGVAISSAEIFYPDTQRWVPTTPMSVPRQLHTATLTPDGNVLVAGGAASGSYSNSAEVFITSTSYWTTVGNMINGRQEHTATLLKNGKVLMAGGINSSLPMNQSETYDYITKSFTAGPALNTARYDHTATQLRDGNVIVIGGSDGSDALKSAEIYNGTNWTTDTDYNLLYNRANHRAVLLPNGKIMVTGGEMRGTAQAIPESFDPDFRVFMEQGITSGRMHHTSVLTRENAILNIGGWNGGGYLATTEVIPFNFIQDGRGLAAETPRLPAISTCTSYFDWGGNITLLSNTSNFHGITEASGGGAGAANSSFSNPRVYMQQIDNPSGFMIDLSTRIYQAYVAANPNSAWDKTLSSITIITPSITGEMPHGWYNMRVAANGQFSPGLAVQVTIPRPSGKPANISGAVLGASSITWTWDSGDIPLSGIGSADGYTVYSATDNVFITTVAFTTPASYTQADLVPNTAASIKISGFNQGGRGALAVSSTYYTLAVVPEPLVITAASFETATLEWTRNNNSELTTYEISMAPAVSPQFSDALAISTPMPFSVNFMSTSTAVTGLSPNQIYDFRVRAKNGAGLMTDFTTPATTVTVSGVNNFSGQALSSSTINWSWDAATGADYYEIYDVTNGTDTRTLIGVTYSTASNMGIDISQTGLSANLRYYAAVNAVKSDISGPIRGPATEPSSAYTLTVQPSPGVPNVFSNVTTGTITTTWITNGNSTWTVYNVAISTVEGAVLSSATTVENYKGFGSLLPNVRYGFTLLPYNGDGIPGTPITLGNKYTLAKVPSSLDIDAISMSGVSLSWDTSGNSDATIYEVRGSTAEDFSAPITPAPVAFVNAYTGSSAFINGLLTSTSYYFDVAARNGENIVTARKRAVAAFTLAGPLGAPSGSVGGTSDPTGAVTISGILPDNRSVSVSIPAGAFASATSIAISSSNTNVCGYQPGGQSVAVEIFTDGDLQPQVPILLTLKFDKDTTATKNAITNDAAKIVLARYNPVSGQCLPLETTVNVGLRTITATLNHFSLFQVMVRTAASNLKDVLVYPNPFYTNRGQGFVTIDRIPASSKVRIYTLSGDKVWEGSAGTTGVVIWKAVNKSGYQVASGIYLAVIDSSAGKKVMKIAVER